MKGIECGSKKPHRCMDPETHPKSVSKNTFTGALFFRSAQDDKGFVFRNYVALDSCLRWDDTTMRCAKKPNACALGFFVEIIFLFLWMVFVFF